MKALKNITVAFLPMNLPYTMTPEKVADAARAFKPKILYPYHTGDTDVSQLVKLLKDGAGDRGAGAAPAIAASRASQMSNLKSKFKVGSLVLVVTGRVAWRTRAPISNDPQRGGRGRRVRDLKFEI